MKWEHYFEIYDSHLKKFIGREINLLEIGVFSGGSLQMWKSYFGPKCGIFGVDIRAECKAFEDDQTRIFIGDQADPDFWQRFKIAVPQLDIVIDDGSHVPEHQIATLEQLLPHIQPGGVYLCEDVHGLHNRFVGYVYGLANRMNVLNCRPGELSPAFLSKFQRSIKSVHLYPFVTVIEKVQTPVDEFLSTRHGTEW
ncbi:MAG TPA: class I SAM-dependent methyltransferase [Chthoniobacterales bacterium]